MEAYISQLVARTARLEKVRAAAHGLVLTDFRMLRVRMEVHEELKGLGLEDLRRVEERVSKQEAALGLEALK